MPNPELEKFIETVAMLRDPKDGCPWDLEQTHESLKRYMLEESYECLEAIDKVAEFERNGTDSKAITELKEELGDMLLQILLHSQIAKDNGHFNIEDVAKLCNDKMRARHPHVFDKDTAKAQSVDDVHKNWDAVKAKEKAARKSIFEGIPESMPALARAWKISKKAVKESFEWDNEDQLWQQLESEIDELKAEVQKVRKQAKLEGEDLKAKFEKTDLSASHEMVLELGDILFTVVNIARWYRIDPEDALRMVNDKFVTRFNKMTEIAKEEKGAETSKDVLKEFSSTELEELWQKAKKALVKG